jgi:hypothetical protein
MSTTYSIYHLLCCSVGKSRQWSLNSCNPERWSRKKEEHEYERKEFIEQHYMAERGLSGDKTVDYLRREYIDHGKLGARGSKGGSYPPGYTTKTPNDAKDDHHNIHAPTLYFLDIGLAEMDDSTHAGRILFGSAEGGAMKTLVAHQMLPDGLDISLADDRIFWTNMGVPSASDGSVWSCKLDGSDITNIVREGSVPHAKTARYRSH